MALSRIAPSALRAVEAQAEFCIFVRYASSSSVPTVSLGKYTVYSFGRAKGGRLGHGINLFNQTKPKLCLQLRDISVAQISSGAEHNACVTADGVVYTWGSDKYGQTARGRFGAWLSLAGVTLSPRKLRLRDPTAQVSCGGWHTLLLSREGGVFACGAGATGRLGVGTEANQKDPAEVTSLRGVRVVKVVAGSNFSFAVTANGELYSWGANDHGQLGLGNTYAQFVPRRVDALAGTPIVDLACGGAHVLAVAEDGSLYSWGSGEGGTLGHGLLRTGDVHYPKKIKFFAERPVRQVAAGLEHSAALTRDGEVFTWGSGTFGQLGHGSVRHMFAPRRVEDLVPHEVSRLVCGGWHSAAITADGGLLMFGRGSYGQLGSGIWGAVAEPARPTGSEQLFVTDAALGTEHTLILAVSRKDLVREPPAVVVASATATKPAAATVPTSDAAPASTTPPTATTATAAAASLLAFLPQAI